MKNDSTYISVVLDRSGSMQTIKNDTIGGFNAFLEDQKKAEGEALFTLAQFDHKFDLRYDGINIKKVAPLGETTYVPRGQTALHDAIGRTINSVGAKLAAMKETDRPAKVIFVIITDGLENCSREFTGKQIKEMIEHQQQKYNWDFVYLGANQDAIAVGESMGMKRGNTMTYEENCEGTQIALKSISDNMKAYRQGDSGVKAQFFNDEDRKKQEDAAK